MSNLHSLDLEWLSQNVHNDLRQEAQTLYERALSEGRPEPLRRFIEQYLAMSPPPFELLYDIADDLQQRLLALREYYFDVRDTVVQAFLKTYNTDITRFAPSHQLHRYHQLDIREVIASLQQDGIQLTDEEVKVLYHMMATSLKICKDVYRDIQLTTQLQAMLEDWLSAYQTVFIRQEQYWDYLEIDASLWLH